MPTTKKPRLRSAAIKPSSRGERVRAEQERGLIVRITIFSVLGLLIVLALVIWGIPALIGVSNYALNSTPEGSTPPTSQGFVSPPTLGRFTQEITKNDSIDVTAYAPEGMTVVLERNGAQVAENTSDAAGSVMFSKVALTEGRNEFRAFVVQKDGVRSEASNTIAMNRDTQIPTIAVDKPFSGESFKGAAQRTITVTGKANDASMVFVNDIRVIMNGDGSFTQMFPLESGENNVTIYAVDEAGNESVKVVRTVRWEE